MEHVIVTCQCGLQVRRGADHIPVRTHVPLSEDNNKAVRGAVTDPRGAGKSVLPPPPPFRIFSTAPEAVAYLENRQRGGDNPKWANGPKGATGVEGDFC